MLKMRNLDVVLGAIDIVESVIRKDDLLMDGVRQQYILYLEGVRGACIRGEIDGVKSQEKIYKGV